jgi:glycosyltransferase involved in cell wall biosynthesis
MKITHVIESSGGSADFVLYLIKYLPHHHHQVIYSDRTFAGRFDFVKRTYTNASFHYWEHVQREIRFTGDLKATSSLYKLLKKLDSDAIHLHSSKGGFIGRIVCFFLRQRNVIYTPNGLAFLRKDVSSRKRAIYVALEKFAHWLNGRVVSCSKSEADALIENGIPSTYVNNGTEIFDVQTLNNFEPRRNLIVATTGRATIQKNPELFNSIAKHFENDSRFSFLWIGSGELEPLLNSKNIEITGWVDRSVVNKRLEDADIYISTALWEGLPFAVLEAMNLGKPLLLTGCVGNVDLVENNYNGYIFSSAKEAIDKIEILSANRDGLKSFGKNSRDLVNQRFNVKSMAVQYEAEYQVESFKKRRS